MVIAYSECLFLVTVQNQSSQQTHQQQKSHITLSKCMLLHNQRSTKVSYSK